MLDRTKRNLRFFSKFYQNTVDLKVIPSKLWESFRDAGEFVVLGDFFTVSKKSQQKHIKKS